MTNELRGTSIGDGLARVEQYDGREHLVVPVVGLVEGLVHAMGASGPELVTRAEFSKGLERWNGRPIFYGHPLIDGRPVSAKTPGVSETAFGHVRHAAIVNDKLTMEAWLDAEKAPDHLLERARMGDLISISIGALVDTVDVSGEHEGRPYRGAWTNITPDHLALLPADVAGACSLDMGCGVRAAADGRYAWPDAQGYDDHGRGAANAATKKAAEASKRAVNKEQGHDERGQAHDKAALAHANAANLHEEVVKNLVGLAYPKPGSEAHAHLLQANQHKTFAREHMKMADKYGVDYGTRNRLAEDSSLIEAGEMRDAWPDKGGMDLHGRESAAAMTASVGAQKQSATAHKKGTPEAHTSAADAHAHASALHAKAATGAYKNPIAALNHQMQSNMHATMASAHKDAAKLAKSGYGRAAEAGDGMEHMAERWLEAGEETEQLLKTLRNIPQSVRDKMPKEDFAGPHESFPIEQPGDVHDAARSIGRAKGDSGPIKAKIIAIAYRKGASFVAQLPEDWKKKKDQKNASVFAKIMGLIRGEVSDDVLEHVMELEPQLKAASCGCHNQPTEAEMTKAEITKFLENATEEQLKALSAVAKPPTEAELKAAADAKAAELKAAADKQAADLKAAADKKQADSIAALKATGKNTLTDEALKALSQADLEALVTKASAPKPPTFDELVAQADPSVRDAIHAGIAKANEVKAASIKLLKDSKRCDLSDEKLKAMSQADLDQLVKLADLKVAIDYSGQGLPRTDGDAPQAVAPPPNMNERIKAARAAK